MTKSSKNDIAWEKLFKHFNILDEVSSYGTFEITSEQINIVGEREARLMTKFDHEDQLPKLFEENKLSILPKTRGKYVIGKFKTFAPLEYDTFLKPIKINFPEWIESIDPLNITSESIALNVAHVSGMIDRVLGNEKSLLTLSGRMKSGDFNFKIKTSKPGKLENIIVNNSQIEIDGGYESKSFIGLVEAKNRIPFNFLIRQLYYPFVLIRGKNLGKEIKPIYFTYAQNIFSFHEFTFPDPTEYSSLKKVKQTDFVIAGLEDISLNDLIGAYKSTLIKPEPNDVPFPQADTFLRVLDLISFLYEGEKSKDEIQERYKFVSRQSDYYLNALRYLGFAIYNPYIKSCTLTSEGLLVASEKNYKKKMLMIVSKILSKKVFNAYFKEYIENNKIPGREKAADLIRENTLVASESTIYRRAKTVVDWVEWIFKLRTM